MAQFDVFRLQGGMLVVDLQTDLIGIEASRIVAPLREAGRYATFPGLTPRVEVEGRGWPPSRALNCVIVSPVLPASATR